MIIIIVIVISKDRILILLDIQSSLMTQCKVFINTEPYYFCKGLIDIPALNQQEQDGVRRPVRYGTKKPKKQQQQQQQQDQEETPGTTEDLGE